MNYVIRVCEDRDVLEGALLGMRSLKEEVDIDYPPSMSRSLVLAEQAAKEKAAVVCETETGLVGILTWFISGNMYNPSCEAMHVYSWYVVPSWRRTKVPYLLMKKCLSIADSRKINVDISLPVRRRMSERTMRKLGFKEIEISYSRRGKWE